MLTATDYGSQNAANGENIHEELGDVYFSPICVANDLGVNMQVALTDALKKYENRIQDKGNPSTAAFSV